MFSAERINTDLPKFPTKLKMYTTLGLDKKTVLIQHCAKKYIISHISQLAQLNKREKEENMWKNYKVKKKNN